MDGTPRLGKRKPKPGGEPSGTGDPLTDRISFECAAAVAWWLDARGGLSYPIKSLTKTDLIGIVWAVISEYSKVREEVREQNGISLFDDAAVDRIILRNDDKP